MFIKTFKQISKKDVTLAGGKGASLGEMTGAKIPVPPGFVVLAPAFDRFLDETDISTEIEAIFHTVKNNDMSSIDRASAEIQEMILDADFPGDLKAEISREFAKLKAPYVAVRSSATAEDSSIASWAGELDTYLNTTKKDLFANIQRCWASLFTPRAIFYRFEKKLHRIKVSVAVVVQAMVQSEVSGITFTVHPVTKDYGQIVVEAGYGLGEAIVGGKITPDTYIVHKKSWIILDKNISEQSMMIVKAKKGNVEAKVPAAKKGKQKLPDAQILKLAKLCGRIEKHYQHPQDIEWALIKNRLYILQSRPITTLK